MLPLLLLLVQGTNAQTPVAAFTANRTSGCAPLSVTFQDQSSGSPTSWNWDFGNGQLSSVQNPVVNYSQPGTYSVTLVVSNADGTHGTTRTDYITVFPSPTVSFSANITTGCVPVTIQFTDLSTANAGNIVSWEWNFGDGTTSTQQNPQKTFTTVGFYSISLKVTSSTGCERTGARNRYIRIVPGVKAEFDNNEPVTCRPPFAVKFNNLTSGPGNMSFTWNFGNSTTSTQVHPTATYAADGTYNVTLTALSEFGCSDVIQKPVTFSGATTSFSSPDTVCLNEPVSFQNTSSPAPVSSYWDFGNGVQSNQTDETISYATANTYPVKLINTYGNCTDSAEKNVTVVNRPTVNFTAPDTTSCQAPFTVNFQDLSPNAASWLWNFGDGNTSTQQNPSHTYTSTGIYNVTLTITDNNGCQNTITKDSFVNIVRTVLNVTNAPNGGCVPYSFTPTVTASAIDGIASWFWDFGDGTTSTLQNPGAHFYTTAGNFTLKLRVTTNDGCTDSVVYVNGIRTGTPLTPNFSVMPTDTCSSYAFSFTNLTTPPGDEWLWQFGDGSTSTDEHPTYSYSDTGTFNVTLTVFNNRCPATSAAQVVHTRPPVAMFSYSIDDCNNKRRVTFDDQSITDPAYGPVSYLWNFGDPVPTTSTIQGDTVFTYPALLDYNVSLIIHNGSCSDTMVQTVRLVGEFADFTVSNAAACLNETVTFTTAGINPVNIAQYEWQVNGGPFIAGGNTFTRAFPTAGTYNISLRITDINGCRDVITKPVSVAGPIANFTAGSPGDCSNTTITFNDLSTPAGTVTRWTWDFGDGQTQVFTSGPFSHSYTSPGLYSVLLTVEDGSGCRSSFRLPDSILITRPAAAFSSSYTTICPGVSMQFTNTTTGQGLQYAWDFGDGATSTLQQPTHIYTGADSVYTVTLVITDTVGCTDSITKTDYIKVRAPKPAFDIADTTTICPPIETIFTFRGQDFESYYWDFGDSATSTLLNPTHFYNDYGSYTPKLYLTGYGGCIDSASATVNVYNPNTGSSLTYSPTRACNELLVDFSITTPPGTNFTFNFGDGILDSSQATSLQHFYNKPAYYFPSLLLEDTQDCQVSISGSSGRIEVIGAIPLFGVDQNKFCDSGTVTFTNYTIGNDSVVSRVWDFGDNTQSGVLHPVHQYSQPNTYEVSQTVTTRTGCTKTIYDTILVYGTPHAQILGDSIVCINELLPLQGQLIVPDTAITWAWNLANGNTSIDTAVTVSYPQAGNYTITLQTSNLLNCSSNTSKDIFVPPLPVITPGPGPVIPVSTGVTLPVTYSDNIATYTWTPATRLSCTDCPAPYANPQFTTTYTITVEDIYGCESTNEITVTVICNEQNYYLPNTFSPNGDGVNDIFAPRGKGLARINSMKIFNRWGELVFERRNFMANDRTPTGGWDGTHKGRPANPDVYVYIVEFVCDNAAIIPFKGNVTLVR